MEKGEQTGTTVAQAIREREAGRLTAPLKLAIKARTRYRCGAGQALFDVGDAVFFTSPWSEVQATGWRIIYAAKHCIANAADNSILP